MLGFCQNLLASKLKLQEMDDTPPAVLIKIGQSLCNQKFYTNFLLLELDRDIVDTIMDFLYQFGSLYQTRVLDYLQEKKGRFVYRGFYRQLLEQSDRRQRLLFETIRSNKHPYPGGVSFLKLHGSEFFLSPHPSRKCILRGNLSAQAQLF